MLQIFLLIFFLLASVFSLLTVLSLVPLPPPPVYFSLHTDLYSSEVSLLVADLETPSLTEYYKIFIYIFSWYFCDFIIYMFYLPGIDFRTEGDIHLFFQVVRQLYQHHLLNNLFFIH